MPWERRVGVPGGRYTPWVSMSNHFHFVIHTPQANLVVGMQWFMNTYTRGFNCRRRGPLFGDRYKSLVIEPPEHAGEMDYLRGVMWYVHLNPVRAGVVTRNAQGDWEFERHRWNSLVQTYLVAPGRRREWSKVEMAMGMEQSADTASGTRKFKREAARRAEEWLVEAAELKERGEPVCEGSSGWFRGSKAFRDWLLDRLERKAAEADRNVRGGPQGHDYRVKRAEELIRIGLECFEMSEEDLVRAKGGDPKRLLIAEAIWKQTTAGQDWMADRLGMKSAGTASQQLRRSLERAIRQIPRRELKKWRKLSRFVT